MSGRNSGTDALIIQAEARLRARASLLRKGQRLEDIAATEGISTNGVRWAFRRAGYRRHSIYLRPVPRRPCAKCGRLFTFRKRRVKGVKYCSDLCARAHDARMAAPPRLCESPAFVDIRDAQRHEGIRGLPDL